MQANGNTERGADLCSLVAACWHSCTVLHIWNFKYDRGPLTIWSCCAEAKNKQAGRLFWPTQSAVGTWCVYSARTCVRPYCVAPVWSNVLSHVWFGLPFWIIPPLFLPIPPSFLPFCLHQPSILHHPSSRVRGEDPRELHLCRKWGGEGGEEREEGVFQCGGRRAGGLGTRHDQQQRLVQVKPKWDVFTYEGLLNVQKCLYHN